MPAVLDRLASLFDTLIQGLEKSGLARHHPLVIGLLLAVIAISLACPDYRRFYPYADTPWAAAAVDWKFAHQLKLIPVAEFAKDAKRNESGIVEHLEKILPSCCSVSLEPASYRGKRCFGFAANYLIFVPRSYHRCRKANYNGQNLCPTNRDAIRVNFCRAMGF